MLNIQCDLIYFNCYCTITPFPLKILWVCFPVLPKLADKSHKPITKGLGCCRTEAFKNGIILLILFFCDTYFKEKSHYICALHIYVNSVHIAGLICPCLKGKKKREIITSAHFESICPLFFKTLSHTVASSAYVRIIFIKCFTVVKHKPDIQSKGLRARIPERKHMI